MSTLAVGVALAAQAFGTPTVEIAPGVDMPIINLGTWSLGNGKPSDPSIGVPAWLAAGGNGIDCAWDYFNQKKVATAIKASGVARERLFITTKISMDGTETKALDKIKTDLQQLGTDYADLVLLHAPEQIGPQWAALEEALEMNLTRSIGISNFNANQMAALLKTAKHKPSVNQCQMSMGSGNHADADISFSQDNGIVYEAWGAMKGCNFTSPVIAGIAKSHNATIAQVCIRYVLDRGCTLAVGTGTTVATAKAYSTEDLGVFTFKLTPAEVKALGSL